MPAHMGGPAALQQAPEAPTRTGPAGPRCAGPAAAASAAPREGPAPHRPTPRNEPSLGWEQEASAIEHMQSAGPKEWHQPPLQRQLAAAAAAAPSALKPGVSGFPASCTLLPHPSLLHEHSRNAGRAARSSKGRYGARKGRRPAGPAAGAHASTEARGGGEWRGGPVSCHPGVAAASASALSRTLLPRAGAGAGIRGCRGQAAAERLPVCTPRAAGALDGRAGRRAAWNCWFQAPCCSCFAMQACWVDPDHCTGSGRALAASSLPLDPMQRCCGINVQRCHRPSCSLCD